MIYWWIAFDLRRNYKFDSDHNWNSKDAQNPNRTKIQRQIQEVVRNRLYTIKVGSFVEVILFVVVISYWKHQSPTIVSYLFSCERVLINRRLLIYSIVLSWKVHTSYFHCLKSYITKVNYWGLAFTQIVCFPKYEINRRGQKFW